MNATVDTVPSVEKTVPGLLPPLSRSGSASPFVATGRSILSALESLGASRVRTFLTMLGIIIGVGAVIIVIAIGQGASAQVNSQLAQLGTNMLTVQPGSANVGGVSTGTGGRPVLSNADVHAIEQLEHVAAISPVVGGQIQVTAGSANWNTRVIGVYPAYQAIATYPIAEGAFFDQTDEDSSGAVAVLGQTVVNTLFPGRDPVGQPVRIRNVIFHVVGVLAPKGSNGFQDQDDIILIPFSAAQLRLYGSTAVQQIQIQVDAPENMSTVMDDATAVLRQTHRLKTSQVNDFTIRNAQQFIATAQQATQTLTVLLTAVAAVSLVVGGIGIMNIMLVSNIGADPRDWHPAGARRSGPRRTAAVSGGGGHAVAGGWCSRHHPWCCLLCVDWWRDRLAHGSCPRRGWPCLRFCRNGWYLLRLLSGAPCRWARPNRGAPPRMTAG